MRPKSSPNPVASRPLLRRRTLKIFVAVAVVFLALIVYLVSLLHPLPPSRITLATGPEGSSYAYYGKRYKVLLAKQGIEVDLKPTAGGLENLQLLRDPHSGVQAGFVEGGVASEEDSPQLLSLGTLGYEPVWFFTHRAVTDRTLFTLKGKRVAVGPEGSDSRALVEELLKRSKLNLGFYRAMSLEPEDAAAQMIQGKVDAAIFMLNWGNPLIRKLVEAPGVYPANFSRADAYVSLFPSLYKLVFPAGAGDLETNKPARDTTLLATKTSLIVKNNLHPALQYLLLEAATQIHSRAGVFQKAGEFPAPEALEIELSPDARHFYKSGRPFLQRYMPFWLAALVEQLIVLIIPVLGIMYPVGKGLASLYGWGMQRKIYLIYGELYFLESEIDKLGNKAPTKEILDRMTHLEQRANRVRVASNYMPMLYNLKETLAYVRGRLDRQRKRG
ncbi:MAG TPA: TAXI family TRAP transporter solute-binding subunit [bacterium]|nr:TAXI family TRAP transporter solute-binding subunit [bacterium]